MKTGLAITTTVERTLHQSIVEMAGCDIHVHTDTERIGVSRSRNNAIKYLYDRGYTHIALMDDDVRFLMSGGIKYCVEAMTKAGTHFIGMPNNFASIHIETKGEMSYWTDLIGAFHIFTRHFIESVGYFNTAYVRYGHEDSEMQYRARLSGLIGNVKGLPSPLRAPFYIQSEDVYGMNPTPIISLEDKQKYIDVNRPIFDAAIRSKRIYYPYEQ